MKGHILFCVLTQHPSLGLNYFLLSRKMNKHEDEGETKGSKTLLVRHLPSDLSPDEKEDLLKYFGAESVRVFSNHGRMVGPLVLFPAEFQQLSVMLTSCFLHRNMQLLRRLKLKPSHTR